MSSLERQEKTFSEFIEQIKQVGKLFGYTKHDGAGWDIEQFGTIFTALRSLLPFQEGDRVELVKNPDCSGAWADSKHFLRKGEEGIIAGIELYQGELTADVIFDNETWIDLQGIQQPVSNKHTFSIELILLRKV